MKTFSGIVTESGAGLWGTDKARKKLQKDTPGQPVETFDINKEFESFVEAGSCWDGYKQVGMKKKGKKMVPNCVPEANEGAEVYIMKKGSYQRKVDGTTADRMKKDGWSIAGRETVSESVNDAAKEAIRKKIQDMQDAQDRLDKMAQEKHAEKKRIRQQKVDNNTKNIAYKKIDRELDNIEDRHRRLQWEKEQQRDKLSETVSESSDIAATLKQAAEKENMKSKRDVERFFDYSGGDIIFKMTKDDEEANRLISKFKSQYKQKFRESFKDVHEGSESWEDGYDRRVVKTTKPEHKEKGYNWRIKGKDKAHLTIKLYKEKPSQAEFNKQMKRVAGHEFGG